MATNPAMAPPPTTTKPAKTTMRHAGDYKRRLPFSRRLRHHMRNTANLTGELVPFVMEKASFSALPNVGRTGLIGVRRTLPFHEFIDRNFRGMMEDVHGAGAAAERRGLVIRIGKTLDAIPLDSLAGDTHTVEQVWMTFKDVDQACYIVYYEQGGGDGWKKFFKIMPDEDMTGMVNTPRQARRIERQARIQVQARAARRQALQAELQARAVRRHARQVAIQGVAQRQAQVQARQLKTQAQVKVQPLAQVKVQTQVPVPVQARVHVLLQARAARREAKVQARAARCQTRQDLKAYILR
ncbi:hypothetical protein BZA05DRAFT_205294 [Tricharina praecox]|uniref:uncharacterized protein n=1 Tax=Tricharina praecox TaxID=43433 RepID=UPI0022205529|nr:uncharacterized protein BZA05DRAFT_255347 [Tricharina praecox]XP_051335057.1 uncharacterized protein BZA05DRAFT_205294 [Tricharina praecox]KAI5840612.1 hypothetical protein BZA05DRAFT_255347 [Tricharina praecox]KAI5842285.1 hypothetical protein BZA05DRAFT_205294 [Tricharina praecox]